MKLTELMNICHISDRVPCTMKVNQTNLHGKRWFPANVYVENGL